MQFKDNATQALIIIKKEIKQKWPVNIQRGISSQIWNRCGCLITILNHFANFLIIH